MRQHRRRAVSAATGAADEPAPTAAPGPAATRSVLRRDLGLREAVAIGVGGTVGGGIFVLVGTAAGRAGPAALLSFVLAFTAALMIALPYAELSCRLPIAGGGYGFVHHVLGPHWGFVMGWGYWGAYLLVSGYVTIGFGGYLRAASGLPVVAGAVALAGACTGLNLLGVRLSGRVQSGVVLAAITGLIGFVAWGAGDLRAANLVPWAPHGATGVLLAALVAFLAFGGFDMVAAAGEEVRDPDRNLPRAILWTLGCVLALYLLVAVVALGVMPAAGLGRSAAPLADAARTFGGATGQRLLVAVALLTTAATANAVLVVTSRIVFGMARDRLLPTWLGRVGARTGVPSASVVLNGVLLAAVAALGSVDFATAAGGFLYVLHFVVPLAALVVLRRREPATPGFRTPAPRVVLPLAFLACAGLMAASGVVGLVSGVSWLAAGALVHAGRTRVASRGLHRRG